MLTMRKGDITIECTEFVKNVWTRDGFVEVVATKEMAEEEIKEKLDGMEVKYHPNLGLEKLKKLLKESE